MHSSYQVNIYFAGALLTDENGRGASTLWKRLEPSDDS